MSASTGTRLGLRFFSLGYLSLLLLIPVGMICYAPSSTEQARPSTQ